jgi:hypothetical protein
LSFSEEKKEGVRKKEIESQLYTDLLVLFFRLNATSNYKSLILEAVTFLRTFLRSLVIAKRMLKTGPSGGQPDFDRGLTVLEIISPNLREPADSVRKDIS